MSAKTLTEYISQSTNDFFYLRSVSSIEVVQEFEVLQSLAIEPYLNILRSNADLIPLTDDEVNKYKYKPRLLSSALYGTENLYYLILLLNNSTVEEFIPKKIYLLTASNRKLVEDIINKERSQNNI